MVSKPIRDKALLCLVLWILESVKVMINQLVILSLERLKIISDSRICSVISKGPKSVFLPTLTSKNVGKQ